MKTIAFFNNKGGVGKTTLVYHIAWMMSELGHNVLAADLDPQANLSSMFLSEEKSPMISWTRCSLNFLKSWIRQTSCEKPITTFSPNLSRRKSLIPKLAKCSIRSRLLRNV